MLCFQLSQSRLKSLFVPASTIKRTMHFKWNLNFYLCFTPIACKWKKWLLGFWAFMLPLYLLKALPTNHTLAPFPYLFDLHIPLKVYPLINLQFSNAAINLNITQYCRSETSRHTFILQVMCCLRKQPSKIDKVIWQFHHILQEVVGYLSHDHL